MPGRLGGIPARGTVIHADVREGRVGVWVERKGATSLMRFDLIRDYVAFLRARYDAVITSVHNAGITIPLLEREGIDVDGYLTPVNWPGMFMFPTQQLALAAIRNARKPIVAIKPLAGGRYLGEKAFRFVFDEVGATACLFGMGTIDQVRETAGAGRRVLGAG